MTTERMSDGEIRARLEGVDHRFKAMDARLAGLDRDCRERSDDIEEAMDKRFKQVEDRGQVTWGRVVAVLTLVLSLLGVAWTVYSSSKGVK